MKKRMISTNILLGIGIFCFVNSTLAAVKEDEITSTLIKEADGISGQDTNTGAGIKTGHIQDGAVTDAKVSDVAIGKVTDLQETLDGKADNSTVTTLSDELATKADQATVDAALAGKADIDHLHYYGNYAIVATDGGDYTNPVDAVADIQNWCGTPAVDNPCLIKIMPGSYDIGDAQLGLPPHVDLEGSGRSNTRITGTSVMSGEHNNLIVGGNTISNFSLTVRGNWDPVNMTGGHTIGAILANGTTRIENIDVAVSGASRNEAIQAFGELGDELIIDNVTLHTHGMGLTYTNIESRALVLHGSLENVKVNNSSISADSEPDAYGGTEGTGVLDGRGDYTNAVRLVVSNSKVDAKTFHTATYKQTYLALYTNTQVVRNGRNNFEAYYYSCLNVFDEQLMPIVPCGNY
jgi:hypothetical protein